MNEYLIYLLVGLICLALGYFLGNYIQNLKTKSNQSALEERQQQLTKNISVLEQRLHGSEDAFASRKRAVGQSNSTL